MNDLVLFYNKPYLSDITVRCNNSDSGCHIDVRCHKIILSRIEYFKELFMKEHDDIISLNISSSTIAYIYGLDVDNKKYIEICKDLLYLNCDISMDIRLYDIFDDIIHEISKIDIPEYLDDVVFNYCMIERRLHSRLCDERRIMKFIQMCTHPISFRKDEYDILSDENKIEYYMFTHPIIEFSSISGNKYINIDFIEDYVRNEQYTKNALLSCYDKSEFKMKYGHLMMKYNTKIVIPVDIIKDNIFPWRKRRHRYYRRKIKTHSITISKL